MMSVSLFDLVERDGKKFTVCGAAAGGRVRLIEKSWPVEFGEVGTFVPPSVVETKVDLVEVLERGQDRLLAVADLLVVADDNAAARLTIDWSDVEAALMAASEVLPSNLLVLNLDKGEWQLSEDVPDEMLLLANPAALIIATHAIGGGDANLSDVERAIDFARQAIAQFRGDAPLPAA
ncbi:hypothetical protein ACVIGB_000374 [Bradyrhizobium sp. USDA 4341]